MAFTAYRTVAGDTWAGIAYKAYGDEGKSDVIAAANMTVPLDVILPAGIVLRIPVDAENSSLVNISLMPPWKQG